MSSSTWKPHEMVVCSLMPGSMGGGGIGGEGGSSGGMGGAAGPGHSARWPLPANWILRPDNSVSPAVFGVASIWKSNTMRPSLLTKLKFKPSLACSNVTFLRTRAGQARLKR